MPLDQAAERFCSARDWHFEGKVGGGAFKEVYRVTDEYGSRWALKLIRHGGAPRIAREIDAYRRCAHPNIGCLHETGLIATDVGDIAYAVEEYLGAGTLTERFAQGISPTQSIEVGRALADALCHLHEKGLVHRDIKPDNVLFRDSSTPVLVDFGLVRDLAATSLTRTWAARGPGTPYFAAPEQLNNEKHLIDWRTDQFSLGVLLSLGVFGRHPYQSITEPQWDVATVERVASRGERSHEFMTHTSGTGFDVLERMTRPWPAQRFRSPAQMLDAWPSTEEHS